MGAFLKEILEPSEQDTFDRLTRMETPSIDTFRSLCTGKGCSGPGLPCARVMGRVKAEKAGGCLLHAPPVWAFHSCQFPAKTLGFFIYEP